MMFCKISKFLHYKFQKDGEFPAQASLASIVLPSLNVSLLHDAFPHATSSNDDLNVDDDDDGILWLDSP